MKTCIDGAYPPVDAPATDAVLIYAGGNAYHVWSPAEIAASKERYRVPCWVRSNPNVASAANDAATMISWLKSYKVPTDTSIMLDLETVVDGAYVTTFGNAMHAAGYLVLPYGSEDSLFHNPVLDGYWVAKPDATSIDSRCVATQYAYDGDYDLSWIADSVPLWDTLYGGDDVQVPTLSIADNGHMSFWVRSVQEVLNARFGQSLKDDGMFGPATEVSVKNAQSFFGAPVTGVVDSVTWTILLGL